MNGVVRSQRPACDRTLEICVWLLAIMVRRSSTVCIGPLNRLGPPSVRMAVSRVWALATPWAAAAATSVPQTAAANIFPLTTRTTLTSFIVPLLTASSPLRGDRAGLLQDQDHTCDHGEYRVSSGL